MIQWTDISEIQECEMSIFFVIHICVSISNVFLLSHFSIKRCDGSAMLTFKNKLFCLPFF